MKLSVVPRLLIQTQRLPSARVGRPYDAHLAAVGGVSPTLWKLTRGHLPRGIRLLSAHGRLTGVLKEADTHLVTFEVSDGLKVTKARTFRIVVLGRRDNPTTSDVGS